MLSRALATPGLRTLTFTLPADHAAGRVSVVGNFNDWVPGATPLEPTADGAVAATVTLPHDYIACFRYLGENGYWFDEPEADFIDSGASVVLGVPDDRLPAEPAEVDDLDEGFGVYAEERPESDATAADAAAQKSAADALAAKELERAEKAAAKERRRAEKEAAKERKRAEKEAGKKAAKLERRQAKRAASDVRSLAEKAHRKAEKVARKLASRPNDERMNGAGT